MNVPVRHVLVLSGDAADGTHCFGGFGFRACIGLVKVSSGKCEEDTEGRHTANRLVADDISLLVFGGHCGSWFVFIRFDLILFDCGRSSNYDYFYTTKKREEKEHEKTQRLEGYL